MNSLIINGITGLFLIITISYSIINIIANKSLYNYIMDDYERLNDDYKRSILYNNLKNKYNLYIAQNSYGEVNITTFIEEVCTGFTFKNRTILERVRSIKNSSSTCILLGVLGTFIGLSLMLLTVNTQDIINSLPATISSMQTAFVTSICGIVCSIVLNILLNHNDCEQALVQLMLKCENLLTSEVSHNKSQSMDSKIEDVKSIIKQISKSIESIERFDEISKDLKDFNNEFINGIHDLRELLTGSQDSIKTFDQSVRKLDKQINILNIKFIKLFDKYDTQEDINKEILLDIKQTSRSVVDSTESQYKIKEYLRSLSSSFSLYERSTQDLLLKLVNHEKKITKTQSDINNEQVNLDTTVKHLASVIAISSQDVEQKLNIIFDYIDIYKEAVTIDKMNKENYKNVHDEEIYDYDIEEYEPLAKYERNSQQLSKIHNKSPKEITKRKSIYTNKLNKFTSNSAIGDDLNDK